MAIAACHRASDRQLMAVAIVLLAVIGLAACAPRPGGPGTEAPGPGMGGTLRVVQEAPQSLDPLFSDSVYESLPINQIFDTLVDVGPSLTVRPALAQSWTLSRDGRVYSFELRDDARFHDGRPVTARDVVFTIVRQLGPQRTSLALPYLKVIDGAPEFVAGTEDDVAGLRVVDERTLQIVLTEPYGSFLDVLAMDNLAIVSERHVLEVGSEEFGKRPVGTGPFRLARWTAERLRLEANTDYYGGRPYLDAVEIVFLQAADSDGGAARFDRRDVDVLEPPADSLERLDRDPDVTLHRYQELSLSFLGLNTRLPPLDQPWLRRAVAHAIDRQSMIGDSPAARRTATGVLPPGISAYSPEPKALPFDPEASRRLLAEHGYPDGSGLPPIRIHSPSRGRAAERLLRIMQSDLAEVGLKLEIVPVSWSELNQQLLAGSAPSFLLGWVADLPDPDAFLRSLFESGAAGNYFGYQNAEVDRLLRRGRLQSNPIERARTYRELERRVLYDAPLVPLYHYVGAIAVREGVLGLEPSPLGLARVEFEHVWLRSAGHSS